MPREVFAAALSHHSSGLFLKAAEQGDVFAQRNLGLNCETGKGIPKNLVQAYMWYSLAAAGGLAEASEYRDRIASRMIPKQITEAERLVREWKAGHPKK